MNENVAAKMVKKHHTDNLLKQTQSYFFLCVCVGCIIALISFLEVIWWFTPACSWCEWVFVSSDVVLALFILSSELFRSS